MYVTIGVWSRTPTQETVAVAWSVAGGQETIVSAADVTAVDNAMASRLSALDSAPVTGPRPVAMAPYRLALARRARGNRYVEAVIRGVPEGAAVAYSVVVTPTSGSPVTLGPYSVLAVLPMFGSSDMIGGRSGDLVDPEPTWIGHVRRDDGVTHVRVDLDDIPAGGTLPVRVRIGGTWLSADYGGAPHNPGGRLPLLDWSADTVTFSAPDPGGVPVVIDVSGRRVAEADAGGPGRSRMLIAHFCIQAVNDLLEVPYSGGVYAPPRTYMQVTMADERGVYSSRPGVTRDQTHPGGYRDGLAMQRPFDIAYHLALNAGVLILTRHDCPDDLADMRIDVGRGLLHPAIAGYGSHRIPYYSADANVRDITADVQVIKAYLGAADGADVFYPDQRLYRQRPATVAALQTPPVRYVVLDSATGYYDNAASVEPTVAGQDLGPGMLWTDRTSGAHVLFIDTTLKDQALGANLDPEQPSPWKPPLSVRRRFMRLALDPHLREHTLLTYGDDFEKACNNGWFEPVPDMREKWAAFLGWVAAHRTWLHVVTTADLDPDRDSVGTIDVLASIDATLDPGGLASVDLDGNVFHYDTWEQRWRDTPAYWLGDTLGGITDRVENALRLWPDEHRDQLYDTAWLAFLMAQHENAWNMQALEGDDPNVKATGDPEEFTIVEGLQVRNALVWLAASVWAAWATTAPPGPGFIRQGFVDDGPVLDALAALPPELRLDPRHWDGDPNPTLVLYNPDALVVIDRNGGRVTHAFVLRDGVPRTVSGTFKSYQYRDRTDVECDGHMLQNTVWTPNHRYIGSDVDLLTRRRVDWTYARPARAGDPGDAIVTRVVPDNFNAYTCGIVGNGVRCTYDRGWAPGSTSEPELKDLWSRDGIARRTGTADRMTWHEDTTFSKTFTLDGTVLRVDYTGVAPGHVVDNELCVDLWAGAQEGLLLSRAADDSGVTLTMDGGGIARLTTGPGCELTPASRAETVAQAADRGLDTEFLTLHRVLTDSVQVRATASDFSYTINFRA
ncbi:MAG: hypothetical protein H0X35_07755 [Pseudonocardiales bacterium]|nr:hypothetical protein [Pseudonocardiales bacterium]